MTAAKIVGAIELPMPLDRLGEVARKMRKQHGEGLVMRQIGASLLVATPGEGDPLGCPCITCMDERMKWLDWTHPQHMIVCPDCGNKRCPKATCHDNACTGSNEPGQDGSVYA